MDIAALAALAERTHNLRGSWQDVADALALAITGEIADVRNSGRGADPCSRYLERTIAGCLAEGTDVGQRAVELLAQSRTFWRAEAERLRVEADVSRAELRRTCAVHLAIEGEIQSRLESERQAHDATQLRPCWKCGAAQAGLGHEPARTDAL
jgi:hypothetical protein